MTSSTNPPSAPGDPIDTIARPGVALARRRRGGALLAGALSIAVVLGAACSSDDAADTTTTSVHDAGHDDSGDDAGDGSTPGGPAPLEGAAMSEEACGHFSTLSASMVSGDPTVAGPSLEMFPASLPVDLRSQGSSVVEGLTAAFDGDPEALTSREFELSFDSVGSAMWSGCEAQSRIDVEGIDYGFEGLPSTVPAGMMALRFTNASATEPHELLILQRPPGNDAAIEDIAELSPEQVMEDFPMIGVVFVDSPDTSATSFIDLPTGSYIVICTIPVGGGETGDPHSQHGMIAALEAV